MDLAETGLVVRQQEIIWRGLLTCRPEGGQPLTYAPGNQARDLLTQVSVDLKEADLVLRQQEIIWQNLLT